MDDRWGLELRWNVRSLLAYAAIAVLLVTAPVSAAILDDHGVPGAIVVLAVLALAAIASGYAVYTTLPTRRRARALQTVASSLEMPFARRFATLDGMETLPSMGLIPSDNRDTGSGFDGTWNGHPMAMFTRSYTFDDYEATVWRSCAATELTLDAPLLRVSHHQGLTGQTFPRALTTGLQHQDLEWEAFDRRCRVETEDPRFAVALLDQRMMEWLMTIGDYAFEAGGSWVMAETSGDDVAALRELLDVLDGFVAHLPRAVLSMYAPA